MHLIRILLFVVLFTTSCSRFEPDHAVLKYSYTLPNYGVNDLHALEALKNNAKAYGAILQDRGWLGEWYGIYYALLDHYFLWGNYKMAERVGYEYVKHQEAYELKFIIAVYMNGGDMDTDLLKKSVYTKALTVDVYSVINDILMPFESIQNDYKSFGDWIFKPEGFDTILILSFRLAFEDLNEQDKKLLLDTIIPLLIEEKTLDRVVEFAPHQIWDRWVKANLIIESYAESNGNILLAEQLKKSRIYAANKMAGSKSHSDYLVYCILNERGIFHESFNAHVESKK